MAVDWIHPLRAPLDKAEPRPAPDAPREDKKNYAQRLSNQLAQLVGDALRTRYPTITPTATGQGMEAPIGVVGGQKRLDVKVADPSLGLILCMSIKTYSFRDYSPKTKTLGRWTKNIKRNDHELRGEAMVLHQRQPYSVLVAVMFEPFATCDDGESSNSSFAHHVDVLKKRSGRGKRPIRGTTSPAWVEFGAEDPRYELFERVFIGLYEHEGPERGSVKFFDVEKSPPKRGRPATEDLLTFQQFIELVDEDVSIRNSKAPVWTDADNDAAEDEE